MSEIGIGTIVDRFRSDIAGKGIELAEGDIQAMVESGLSKPILGFEEAIKDLPRDLLPAYLSDPACPELASLDQPVAAKGESARSARPSDLLSAPAPNFEDSDFFLIGGESISWLSGQESGVGGSSDSSCAEALRIGSSMMKVVPLPSSESTLNRPLCLVTMMS